MFIDFIGGQTVYLVYCFIVGCCGYIYFKLYIGVIKGIAHNKVAVNRYFVLFVVFIKCKVVKRYPAHFIYGIYVNVSFFGVTCPTYSYNFV